MSADALPISAASFAQAIQDLPMENLYAKASELSNSIAHLQRSNAELKAYSDGLGQADQGGGDKDCLEAIAENQVVIGRQHERLELLKAEVERRGGRWHERDGNATENGNGSGGGVNGHDESADQEDDDQDDGGGLHL